MHPLNITKDEDKLAYAQTSKDIRITNYLAKDPDWYVRYYVTQNPSTSVKTLDRLAKDPDPDVRYWVARNPLISIESLDLLAKDPDSYVSSEAKQALTARIKG